MKLFDDIQLRIGCYWLYSFVLALLLFIVLVPHHGTTAGLLFAIMIIVIALGFIYHQYYAKERLNDYTKMLISAGKKKLLIPHSKAHVLLKKGAPCNQILGTRKEYKVSIIYFSDDFLTLSTKCPPFHLFKLARGDMKDKWAVKKSCAVNKEYYYAYIQSVHFNPENKKLDIVLSSGDIESIESDKKQAEVAVNLLREKLRTTDRGIQTNPIKY